MEHSEFISEIAKYVQKYASEFNITVCSPIIAQAILESGWGTSTKAQHNNFFGLKYREGRLDCHNGTFVDGSSEQEADGSYVDITDQWYSFDSMEMGVKGYFQFTNILNYSNLKGVSDPLTYLQNIKADGYATSLTYVDNVYRVITENNLTRFDNVSSDTGSEDNMSNSGLVTCRVMSPNHSGARTHSIDRITPHCVVGQLSASSIGGCFTSEDRRASCNYGIGTEGGVCLIVDEANRSWCSSSNANDQRAVTIECASDKTEPYAFNSTVYNKLIELCDDICRRNGKNTLVWIADKNTALNYEPAGNEMLLTVHRWFANKSCPGDWMYNRMGDLASQVTARLGGSASTPSTPSAPSSDDVTSFPDVPFSVKVIIDDLNYRSNPSMSGSVNGQTGKGVFTIIEVNNGWGRLKSGAGWIYLGNTSYCEVLGSVSAPAPTPSKKSVAEIAAEVLRGDWGNGQDRIDALNNAGYNAAEVQQAVNALVNGSTPAQSAPAVDYDAIARAVLRGDYGNGSDRRNRLVNEFGEDGANKIQAKVNELCS